MGSPFKSRRRAARTRAAGAVAVAAAAVLASAGSHGPAAAHPAPHLPDTWVQPPLLAAPAPPRPVQPPLRLTLRTAAGGRERGAIEAFDAEGFRFRVDDAPAAERRSWRSVDPARTLRIHERLLEGGDARAWLNLGAMLYRRSDTEDAAADAGEQALRRALRIDPELAAAADGARRGLTLDDVTPGDAPAGGASAEADGGGASDPPAGDDTEGEDPAAGPTGPITEGPVQAQFWGELTHDVMQASVQELRREVEQDLRRSGLDLKLYDDSPYFLVASDLSRAETGRWTRVLDRMYLRLCDTFAVERGRNVFRGRGLVYLFRDRDDYVRFHAITKNGYDARPSGGLCQSRGDGRVEISVYRHRSDELMSHVLVHEAVHGFLHRYRSFPFVVSWVNEGLAEFVAADLVGLYEPREKLAQVRVLLARRGGTWGLLGDGPIKGWQYPVAQALCDFMIAQNRGRYRDFVNAIKGGKDWRQALQDDYGVDADRLLAGFGVAVGYDGTLR